MRDFQEQAAPHPLEGLTRPPLLVKAARIGLMEYSRQRNLRRILRLSALPDPRRAFIALKATEAELNDQRRGKEACYSVLRHLEVLIALMHEARLLDTAREQKGGSAR